MTPDYLNGYDTVEYTEFLVGLITQAKTKRALKILYQTMPTDSPSYARVVNYCNQFRAAEIQKHDGLAGWREEMSRINLAVIHLTETLLEEYPYAIPLRTSPLLITPNNQITYDPYDNYVEEELVAQPRPSSRLGLGMVLGILLVGVIVFFLAKSSESAVAGADAPQTLYDSSQIGWVLLLEDGTDCESLAKRYDFVFRHHGDAEVMETNRGGCSLLIRFPDKAAAEKRKQRSSSLKRTFPGSQVVKL